MNITNMNFLYLKTTHIKLAAEMNRQFQTHSSKRPNMCNKCESNVDEVIGNCEWQQRMPNIDFIILLVSYIYSKYIHALQAYTLIRHAHIHAGKSPD